MLLLPSRSPQHPRGRCNHSDNAITNYTISSQGSQSLATATIPHLQRQEGDRMMATTPNTTPPMPKRPKLSLQTSNVSSLPGGHKSRTVVNLTVHTQTPTYGNTYLNAFDSPSAGSLSTPSDEKTSPQSSPEDRSSPSSSNSSATTATSCNTSPFTSITPYCLPLGSRSILRNSPLPRRLVSGASTRTTKLLFPRTKRVCFHDRLEDFIPTPLVDETPDDSEASDSDSSEKRLEDEISERKALDDLLEEEEATPQVNGRRKCRREWIWRPLEDDILSPPNGKISAMDDARAPACCDRPVLLLKREETVSEDWQKSSENFQKSPMSDSDNNHDQTIVAVNLTAAETLVIPSGS